MERNGGLMKRCTLVILGMMLVSPLAAQTSNKPIIAPPSNPFSLLNAGTPEALAGNIRGYLVTNLSPVLFEDTHDWGHVKMVKPHKGPFKKNDGPPVPKNDGVWRKVTFTADNLRDTLVLDIRDVQSPGQGRITFNVYVSFDARVKYEQQNWNTGARTYSGEVRARMRIRGTMQCEATAKIENSGGVLPDLVFRMHVVQAHVAYDNLVVEHVPGIGGDLANLMGQTFKSGMDRWKPSIEKNALTQASDAIVKSADTKDVRVSLTKMFQQKGLLPK